jgi:Haem-binding uptake, Tiki superfamily, ChaN
MWDFVQSGYGTPNCASPNPHLTECTCEFPLPGPGCGKSKAQERALALTRWFPGTTMGSNSALRLRRSAAQLHALAQVEREIRATDSTSRCRYLRDFAEAFLSYERVLSAAELHDALCASDILLVGDYHALPASQRYVTTVLELLARSGRPVVIAVEAIFARHQRALEEWMAGSIPEDELRERIRFDLDWGYGWQPYRELLDSARRQAQGIYGLDCMPRTDLRRIAARDRHAASKIAEIRERHPGAAIVVLFGESHLAPNHLPALLRLSLPRERILTVLQNVDTLYWRAAGEAHDRVDAVRVADNVVCVFTSTPLEKYESYRLCIERWRREGSAAPDLAPSVYNLIDALLRFLKIDKYSASNGTQPKFLVDMLPEVWCRPSKEQLEKLLVRKGVSDGEIREVLLRIATRGVCHVPSINSMFVTSFQVEFGAEEAARFVHHACQGTLSEAADSQPQASEDRFYRRVLQEALAFLGSRVLYPARAAVRESDLYVLYAQPREAIEEQTVYSYREYMEMIDFLVLHKDFESNSYRHAPELIRTGVHYTGRKFEYVTETLGQMLGNQLYEAYISGRIAKRFLRSLFLRRLDRPGGASAAYYAAARKIAGKPKRFRVM